MKILKSLPLILTLLTSEQALAQRYWNPFNSDKKTEVKQNKTDSKTRLLPIKFKGDINPILSAWATGTTGTSPFLNVYGPFEGQGFAVKGKDTISAYFQVVDSEKVDQVIKQLENTNPNLRSMLFRDELDDYVLLRKESISVGCFAAWQSKEVFRDLTLGQREFDALPFGKYKVLGYYMSEDKKASIPVVFLIEKNKEIKKDVSGVKDVKKDKPLSLDNNVEMIPIDTLNEDKKYFELGTRYGVEAGAGSNGEKVLGAFVSIPLNQYFSLEGYGDFYAGRGNPIVSDSKTQVTEYDPLLIGTGTYEYRTDKLTRMLKDKAVFELGLGLSYNVDKLVCPVRMGLNFAQQEKTLNGEATIVRERNMVRGDPRIITNSKDLGKSLVTYLAVSAGILYDITNNLEVGGTIHRVRVGEENSVRVNVRYLLK